MGRVARKLIALLEELGYTEVRLHPAMGAHRTDARLDCARWEASANRNGARKWLQSFDTMTLCVKLGITVSADGEVSAKR